MKWEFYLEAAALLRLSGCDRVPAVRHLDRANGVIEMDYLWGQDLRQQLAHGQKEIEYDEVAREFSALMSSANHDVSKEVNETMERVLEQEVVPRDVHPGNFIRGKRTGRLYLVDFNFVYLRWAEAQPGGGKANNEQQ